MYQDRVICSNQLHCFVGIVRQAVAGADDPLVAGAIGQPNTWAEPLLAGLDAAVPGDGADPAQQHLSGVDVVAFDPTIGPAGNRELLPASAVIDCEFVGDSPAVASIAAQQPRPYMIFIGDLQGSAGAAPLADQESSNAVVPGAAGGPPAGSCGGINDLTTLRDAAVEPESSLRAEAAGDELSLRLVKCHAVDVAAEPDVVLLLHHVEIHHVLRLRVVAVVRHEVFSHPDRSEVLEF